MKLSITALIILLFPYNLYSIEVPEGQPKQIESIVQYNATLGDLFFESNEWSYPDFVIKIDEDRFEDTKTGKILKEKDIPRLKHTAKCITSSIDDHLIKYCDTKLLSDGSIELYFHEFSPAYYDNLLIIVERNKFTSQYWTAHIAVRIGEVGKFIWTTKKQNLVLDKIKYYKNDIIKGKIEFECLEQNKNPEYEESRTISISGVFKTIIK